VVVVLVVVVVVVDVNAGGELLLLAALAAAAAAVDSVTDAVGACVCVRGVYVCARPRVSVCVCVSWCARARDMKR